MAARTYAAIDEALAEPVGERQLKGFSRPMPVYAALARAGVAAVESEAEVGDGHAVAGAGDVGSAES